jgi:hypothetical protein
VFIRNVRGTPIRGYPELTICSYNTLILYLPQIFILHHSSPRVITMISKVFAERASAAAVPFVSDQASDIEVKLNHFSVGSKSQKDDDETQSKSHIPVSPVLTPGTPILLSPSSLISSPPSPSTGSIVWDTPITPLRHISKQDKFGTSTPLTPPTTSDNFWKTDELQDRRIYPTGKSRKIFTLESAPDTESDTTSRTLWPPTRVADRVESGNLFSDESLQSSKIEPIHCLSIAKVLYCSTQERHFDTRYSVQS